MTDIVAAPLAHDTPAEIAQPEMQDWIKGEVEAIPGKTMPNFKVVSATTRTSTTSMISLGPQVRENGLGAHGTHYDVEDFYDELVESRPRRYGNGSGRRSTYPSLERDARGLQRDPGSRHGHQRRAGLPLVQEHGGEDRPAVTHLAEGSRDARCTFAEDLQRSRAAS